jgi:hypothetical protein
MFLLNSLLLLQFTNSVSIQIIFAPNSNSHFGCDNPKGTLSAFLKVLINKSFVASSGSITLNVPLRRYSIKKSMTRAESVW